MSNSVATAATIRPPASRTGSALIEITPRDPSARRSTSSRSETDSPVERLTDECQVGCARLGRACRAEDLLGARVREHLPAGRRLGDQDAQRQLADERAEALAFAVRLLVERAVVDRERDAPRELLGELDVLVVERALALPAERQRAERPSAHHEGRGQHRAQLDRLHRRTVLGAPVRAVGQLLRQRHELRPALADRDRHRRVAGDLRREALERARGLLQRGIGVDDRAALDRRAVHEIDDTLVGDRRDHELGERAKRGVRVERAREVLADRGEHGERLPRAALGVVQARALECVRAVVGERRREGTLRLGEPVPALEAEPERTENRPDRPQRDAGGRGGRRGHVRVAPRRLALVQEDRLATRQGVPDRGCR